MGAVDTTYTFTATDTITSTKMNNIIDQTTMTTDAITGTTLDIFSGKLRIRASGVTSNELASDSVTTNQIANNSVTTNKLANSSVTSDKLSSDAITNKLNSGQVGVAPIIGARAVVQMRNDQGSFTNYTSIAVTMTISPSGSPRTVTVTSATNHGFLAGEPFFIYMENPSPSLNDQYFCCFVDSVVSPTQFTFITNSSALLNASGTIYFIDATKYKSINIKRVSPGRAILNSQSLLAANSFPSTISGSLFYFNAAFSTPLENVDNAVVIGSDILFETEVGLKYFNFFSPRVGLLTTTPSYYNRSFSICVFA